MRMGRPRTGGLGVYDDENESAGPPGRKPYNARFRENLRMSSWFDFGSLQRFGSWFRGELFTVTSSSFGLALSALVLSLLAGASAPLQAQDRYTAFGDSITEGAGFDGDCTADCGYPRRVRNRLSSLGVNVPVNNWGLGGERTPEGLTRLEEVFDEINANAGEAVLLMEGTNDISRPDLIDPETTLFNLREMGRLASQRGVETIHATLIPRYPDATVDADNVLNSQMARDIRDLAFSEGRRLVDPYTDFSAEFDLFNTYYSQPDFFDPVGHPNSIGFGLLAQTFVDMLTEVDTVAPGLGFSEPANGDEGISALARIRVRVYDFGDGINPSTARMTVNGAPVAIDVSVGGENWLDIVHRPLTPLPDFVRVAVEVSDLAPVPNTLSTRVADFNVTNQGQDLCEPDDNTLCIDRLPGDRRFRVTMTWSTAVNGGQSGVATVTPLADLGFANGGLLSFFPGTPEALVKVLDACDFNNRFWVFAAPTTELGFELVIEDLVAKALGASSSAYTYRLVNTDGQTATAVSDLSAFSTCNFN